MIIRKIDGIYIIKIPNDNLKDFDYFNQEKIIKLFEKIIKKIKKRYSINGLLDIDVYINEYYGIIMEINPIYSLYNEIDMRIHFHLNNIFMTEINENEINNKKEVYYYNNKYYSIYNGIEDSNIIYKVEKILEKGIKIV